MHYYLSTRYDRVYLGSEVGPANNVLDFPTEGDRVGPKPLDDLVFAEDFVEVQEKLKPLRSSISLANIPVRQEPRTPMSDLLPQGKHWRKHGFGTFNLIKVRGCDEADC